MAFLSLCFLSLISISVGQTKNMLYTELFFEYGFANCKVSVVMGRKVIYNESITSVPNSGPTAIVRIFKLNHGKLKLKLCGQVKILNIKYSKFYTISIIENKIEIKELEEEPLYV